MKKNDIDPLNNLCEIIRKEGSITKGRLYKESKLGIWVFEKVVKYIPDVYDDIIYDKKSKKFIARSVSLSLFIQEAEK